jgi:hypothetical protein
MSVKNAGWPDAYRKFLVFSTDLPGDPFRQLPVSFRVDL